MATYERMDYDLYIYALTSYHAFQNLSVAAFVES